MGASLGEFVLCCIQPDETDGGGREAGKSWGKGREREETVGERGDGKKDTGKEAAEEEDMRNAAFKMCAAQTAPCWRRSERINRRVTAGLAEIC